VPVQVHLLGIVESDSENFTRSASQNESEIVSTSIGDGMLLEMNMERDTSSLRLGTLEYLQPGTHFRVIAIEYSSKKVYSYGDFIVGGATSRSDFHVHVGDRYDFICISYNSTDLPSHTYTKGSVLPTFNNINNGKDLLWWIKAGVTVTTLASVDLQIELRQRLAKVKMIIDCDYNKWGITGVGNNQITVGAIGSGTLNWSTGAITGTATDQGPTWPTPTVPYPTQHTSNELRIIPTTGNATVKILASAISRSGLAALPIGVTTVTFTAPLSAGGNYTLRIKLRTPIWARSNIYWDATTNPSKPTLTFVPAGSDISKEGWQGVFFRWGSLVGIAPTGTHNTPFTSSIPIYVPYDYPAAPKWKATTGAAVGADSDIPGTSNYETWTKTSETGASAPNTDIPYLDGGYITTGTIDDLRNRYAIDEDRNTTDMYQSLRGDICQYLSTKTGVVSGNYRLPTAEEMGEGGSNWNRSDGWERHGGADDAHTATAAGTYDAIGNGLLYALNTSMDNVRFPHAGYRMEEGSRMIWAGMGTYYWNGSAYRGQYQGWSHSMLLSYNNMFTANKSLRCGGFAIRCVKN
jgi:hypothetical protein